MGFVNSVNSMAEGVLDKRERQLRDAERRAKETGATLTPKYYEAKRDCENLRNHYEDLKRQRSDY